MTAIGITRTIQQELDTAYADVEDNSVPIIESQPRIRSGKPYFKGTRITVYDVLEYLEGGMTEAELLDDFPALTPQYIRAAQDFSDASERQPGSDSTT